MAPWRPPAGDGGSGAPCAPGPFLFSPPPAGPSAPVGPPVPPPPAPHPAGRPVRRRPAAAATPPSAEAAPESTYKCPVCERGFDQGNALQYHYDMEHAPRDPSVVTWKSYECPDCKKHFAWQALQRHKQTCPARLEFQTALEVLPGQWMDVMPGPLPRPPETWWVATDGSGKDETAGWGAVVFRFEGPGGVSGVPDFVLHAPVVTKAWDHRWLGARDETNNTAELSAIGEVMHWLLEEAPDYGDTAVHLRYDSEYAANVARGIWTPRSNLELADAVRKLVAQVMERRRLTWEWVRGHSGAHDNELADRAAEIGRRGWASTQSRRWTAPPPEIQAMNHTDWDVCKKCGVRMRANVIGWHVSQCQALGRVIPEGKALCRKCGQHVKEGSRWKHETHCRGSELANRTCRNAGKYSTPPQTVR